MNKNFFSLIKKIHNKKLDDKQIEFYNKTLEKIKSIEPNCKNIKVYEKGNFIRIIINENVIVEPYSIDIHKTYNKCRISLCKSIKAQFYYDIPHKTVIIEEIMVYKKHNKELYNNIIKTIEEIVLDANLKEADIRAKLITKLLEKNS